MQFEFIDQTNNMEASQQSLSRDGLYGDGFFTTGIIKKGQILHWDYHLERVLFSASRLYFNDFDLERFRISVENLIEEKDNVTFRISVTRCQKIRGYAIADNALTLCKVTIYPLITISNTPCELIYANTPVSVNSYLAGIKHLNKLDSVLAANEIKGRDQEALLFSDDQVICGSRSNLFVLKDKLWHTPLLNKAGVNGITRLRVLKQMEEKGINCNKSQISRDDLSNISAAFVTNSIIGIWPATSIQGKPLDVNESIAIQNMMENSEQ